MALPKTLTQFIGHFVKKQRASILMIQITAFAWSVDNTIWPYAFKLLIDKILAYTPSHGNLWYYLMPVLLFWIGLWVLIEIGFRVSGFMMAYVFPRLAADIRMSMFDYVEGHSYDFFASNFAGNLSNKISDMTHSAVHIVQMLTMLFIPAFVALLIAGGMFASIKPYFAFLLIGWAILHMGICFVGGKRCAKLSDVHATSRSFLTGKIVDSFTNIINVKLFTRRRFEYDYINRYQADEKMKNKQALIAVEKIKVALGISSFLFPGVLLTWYLIYSWQHGHIGVGDVVYILYTTSNIMLLAWFAGLELPNFFKEIGISQQALSIIRAPHDISDSKEAKTLQVKQGRIDFENVSFNYVKENRVFENITLTIEAGTKVGLVGYSGGGKSTFVNLIMRFFDIDSGRILIDGQDISRVTLASLRSQISMIPQNPSLFHRTLRENISYGNTDATEEEILKASKQAHCHEFISELPLGYNALVGERGIKLSGGQRQRVAIARALVEGAPILILDEATSALDSVTEKFIQDGLNTLMKDRTTIVIAHRLSTLSEMDRIIVFDKGKIIEDGTHDQLLKQNKHYATMWRMQAGGFLPESAE